MENQGLGSSADKTVLLVDDDKDVMALLEEIVRGEGFQVLTAEDGVEAQKKARALSPDIIVLDLMLPKAGGLETLHELQSGNTSHIPVIVITGRRLEHNTAERIKQQVNVRDYLEKPVKADLLASRLHQILKTQSPKKV